MKIVDSWKLVRSAICGFCAVAAFGGLSGCSVAMGPSMIPQPQGNEIVGGCVLPGSGNKFVYKTSQGDLLYVKTWERGASVDVSTRDYSFHSSVAFNLTYGPLTTIYPSVTVNSNSAAPPSLNNLYGQYKNLIAAAATKAHYAADIDPSTRPNVICGSTLLQNLRY